MDTLPKPDIRGTQTERNLVTAYLAESAAYTRYTYYASQAHKENYFPIEVIFTETAANEFRHSKIFFKYLQGGTVKVPMEVDAGVIGTTAANLATAAHEEKVEGYEMYKAFAATAREEGFDEIADHFDAIAEIEVHHRERFIHYQKQVLDGTVWKRDHVITWKCLVCGFEYRGTEPPMPCPACDHPYQHYMAMDYNDR